VENIDLGVMQVVLIRGYNWGVLVTGERIRKFVLLYKQLGGEG
jgi:hypothetical protein